MTGDALDRLHRKMLAETMRCCRELPEYERQQKRKTDRAQQERVDEWCHQQAVDNRGDNRQEAS